MIDDGITLCGQCGQAHHQLRECNPSQLAQAEQAREGLSAIVGKWPDNEADEEIEAATMNPPRNDGIARELQEAKAEIERLKTRLLTAAGDDLCRLSQEEIKQMSAGTVKIPPKAEFLASCERFHAQVAAESGVMENCLTLAQLVAENEKLKAENENLRHGLRCSEGWGD